MALKRLALLGTPRSQWVPLTGMKSPRLEVRGLPAGAELCALVDGKRFECSANGFHTLEEGHWLVILCPNAARTTICEVHGKAA